MQTEKITYKSLDDNNILKLIQSAREGIDYTTFVELASAFPLRNSDWSRILHLSERTIQRYKRDKKKFDPIHTEKILQVMLLMKRGEDVFENSDNFIAWLSALNIAMGGIKPLELLDNIFGINMVRDELGRIEHGILA